MKIKYIDLHNHSGGLIKLDLVIDGDISAISDEITKIKESPDKWEVEFKKVSSKRSLDANAYAWVLIDKLAKRLYSDKVSVYREIIRDVPGVSRIVCVQEKDAEAISKEWQSRGIGWQTEEMPSKIEGCVNLILYKGSSEFNSSEMNTFIDLIIQECKEQKIETLTPLEIERLKHENSHIV